MRYKAEDVEFNDESTSPKIIQSCSSTTENTESSGTCEL